MTLIEKMRQMIINDIHYFGRDLDEYFADFVYDDDDYSQDEYDEVLAKGKEILAELERQVRTWTV